MNRRIALLLFVVILLAIGWWAWGDKIGLDAIAGQEHRLRELVGAHPIRSPLVGFAAYVALSLVPGTTGKAIVYGWLFGFWVGLAISSIALTIAAVTSLLVVRYAFRDLAQRKLSALVRTIDLAVARSGPTYLVSLRLLHAPYTLTNYASAATAIPACTFAWTTYVGMLPGTVVFVLAGSSLPSLDVLKKEGVWSIIDLRLLVLLSLLAFLPILTKAVRDRFPDPVQDP
jgi:uncharacterized membrane protein YdjX (TVP38/TMEM64 family)